MRARRADARRLSGLTALDETEALVKSIDEVRLELDFPAVTADHHGFITWINERFQASLGWRPDELIGKSLLTIIPAYLHDAHNLGFSRFLATGVPTLLNRPLKLTAVRRDGTLVQAEHFITAEQVEGRWVFGATLRPLDE